MQQFLVSVFMNKSLNDSLNRFVKNIQEQNTDTVCCVFVCGTIFYKVTSNIVSKMYSKLTWLFNILH